VRRSYEFKGVFFDLYGTLLVFGDVLAAWDDWLSAFYEQLHAHGLAMSKEEFAEVCDGFFGRPEPPPRGDGLTLYERRIAVFAREVGLEPTAETIRAAARETIAAWGSYMLLDPDAIPALEALQPHKTLALISNFDHPPHVRTLLSETGLAEFFEAVVISGEVGVKKPDPRVFAPAFERTGLQPHEVVFVGDTEGDVEGARAAGVHPIRIQRGGVDKSWVADDFRSNQQAPERAVDDVQTISSLRELVAILTREGN
jgi:HAD superfamily hydrolase (TIGR01549 family)